MNLEQLESVCRIQESIISRANAENLELRAKLKNSQAEVFHAMRAYLNEIQAENSRLRIALL